MSAAVAGHQSLAECKAAGIICTCTRVRISAVSTMLQQSQALVTRMHPETETLEDEAGQDGSESEGLDGRLVLLLSVARHTWGHLELRLFGLAGRRRPLHAPLPRTETRRLHSVVLCVPCRPCRRQTGKLRGSW